MDNILVIALIIGGFFVVRSLVGRIVEGIAGLSGSAEPTLAPPDEPAPDDSDGDETTALEARMEFALSELFEAARHPEEVALNPVFQQAIQTLAAEPFETANLRKWIINDRRYLHWAAVFALIEREGEKAEENILAALGNYSPWGRYLTLMALDQLHPPPTPWVHELLILLDRTWVGEYELRSLREWLSRRRQDGEGPPAQEEWNKWLEELDGSQEHWLREILHTLGPAVARPWLSALSEYDSSDDNEGSGGPPFQQDVSGGDPLTTCGRLWTESNVEELETPVPASSLETATQRLLSTVVEAKPRPVVVVGPARTGKTTLIHSAVRQLTQDGWRVLEASPDQINAGMSFIGQMEERVGKLANATRPGQKVLWFSPNFSSLLSTGSLTGDEGRSIARSLRPELESRRCVFVGECTREEWEHAKLDAPWMSTVFEIIEVVPASEEDTLRLVGEWLARESQPPRVDAALLHEAWHLTRQFVDETLRPGNLFDTVKRALEDQDRGKPADERAPLQRDDLLRSLSDRTGLPLELLDDRRALALSDVDAFFRKRILGQDEAVQCLIDRLAMVKAGVTDPTRPLGVFMFAGPTGTGKTELAKALTSWLFGSSARMLRLDMSELKDASALDKLLGSGSSAAGTALVDRIRAQPFSVVLLDEFEKAHPEVWDLFLQVFDDGRLSDRRGRTADFRHSMIIMTTNLGGRIETKAGLGFSNAAAGFRADKVEEAIKATFRPEFLNRLDRTVVFHPLSREIMRGVLERQIESAFARRGLRDRQWAVEWDETALDLLLDKGFSEDLGARPLQRALERYLLTPLALTIATQQAPAGDQFLFLRAEEDELVIDFVDPDAPELRPIEAAPAPTLTDTSPAAIALDPRGTAAELQSLDAELRRLENDVEDETWQRARQAELEMMNLSGFWESPERFDLLDVFETRERVQRSVTGARSLMTRLSSSRRDFVPAKLVARLAQRLHLLRAAVEDLRRGLPREVRILVAAQPRSPGSPDDGGRFARDIEQMYRAWCRERGAHLEDLDAAKLGEPQGWAASIRGFGAWSILHPEDGLHVLEVPEDGRQRSARHAVRVRVMPPPAPGKELMAATAPDDAGAKRVVRRYRAQPSPLVRDSVRGWRTGRLDRVLSGNFDLLGADGERHAEDDG